MSPDLEPIEFRTLRDSAYARLRGALMSGQFEPGQHMTIRGLAVALGASSTPIREALRRLAAERAIEAEPNKWMRIPMLSTAELQELRAIRVALEGLAAAEAARLMTKEEMAQVRRLDAEIVALRPITDVKAAITLISRLHFTIYAASRMPALVQIIEGLWLRVGPYVNLLFPGYTQGERGVLRGQTIRALQRHDSAEARHSMEQDVGRAMEYLIALSLEPRWPHLDQPRSIRKRQPGRADRGFR